MTNTDRTLIMRYNLDSNNNTMAVKIDNEAKQISPLHYCVQLQQIADEQHRMVVADDLGNELIEVYNMDEIKENNYYINYTSSVVYFHPSKAGKTFIFNYYGLGIELISASRIYDETTWTGEFIIRTIQEIIDKGRECIEALSTIGDAVKLLKRIENYIIIATELDIKLREDISIAQPLQESLHQDIIDSNEFRIQLNKDVNEGKILQPILQQTVDDANDINTILNNSTQEAQEVVNLVQSVDNPSFDILIGDWVVNTDTDSSSDYMFDLPHGLQTEKLIVECKEKDSKMSVLPDYKNLDINTIRFFSNAPINLNVLLNPSYKYGGSVVTQEVIDARKDEVSLKAKIDNIDTSINALNTEIITARGSDLTLDERLDGIDLQLSETISNKQDKTDNTLTTINKTIVGAINENTALLSNFMNFLNNGGNIGNLNLYTDEAGFQTIQGTGTHMRFCSDGGGSLASCQIVIGNDNGQRLMRPITSQAKQIDLGSVTYPFKDLYLGTFATTDNGYTKLPNGLILQWGTNTIPASTESLTVPFPLAFPTKYFGIFPVNIFSNLKNVILTLGGSGVNTANFSIYPSVANTNAIPTVTVMFKWIAIGF